MGGHSFLSRRTMIWGVVVRIRRVYSWYHLIQILGSVLSLGATHIREHLSPWIISV